jgi:hypothetical protein
MLNFLIKKKIQYKSLIKCIVFLLNIIIIKSNDRTNKVNTKLNLKKNYCISFKYHIKINDKINKLNKKIN